ncbi:MAG: helix-turn-helix transcriptional regulator [Desulfobacterales bacterium]|nr:helix-turn-helix transcriptional regulator [Desulfobacterales bacterium]
MSDNTFPGGPVMVKIDGAKIRRLREEKGLTQLYIATAVDVTTDTVSRWENKRYPSIKKENGLKLAEALEVSLEDILESETIEIELEKKKSDALADNKETVKQLSISLRALLLILLFCLPIAAALIYVIHFKNADDNLSQVSIRRIVATHFIAGSPLPIFFSVSMPDNQSVPIILRENIPSDTLVKSTFPAISAKHKKNDSITWLDKVSGPRVFYYTITTDNKFQGTLQFEGAVKYGSSRDEEQSIEGNNQSESGLHHWADSNRDNRISDEEILSLYDLIGNNAVSGFDINLIEEMWLGDGYIWNPNEQKFVIIE